MIKIKYVFGIKECEQIYKDLKNADFGYSIDKDFFLHFAEIMFKENERLKNEINKDNDDDNDWLIEREDSIIGY